MIYRSARRIFRPDKVRAKRFGSRWRGLDPAEVYAYLRALADELDRAGQAESTAQLEAERLRQTLGEWRSRHARCWFVDPHQRTPPRTPNRGRW
ncbi:DivIVA domain-containing protein [Plantactinospora sp. B6F1]|uniref:DivIVA domain-containing protein n=1 Tax=Plantactinospora sp. B6F1 TaxID=3158971 RepID=UPI0032D91AEF